MPVVVDEQLLGSRALRFKPHRRTRRAQPAAHTHDIVRRERGKGRDELRTTPQNSLCCLRIERGTFVPLFIGPSKYDVVPAGNDIGKLIEVVFINQQLTETIMPDPYYLAARRVQVLIAHQFARAQPGTIDDDIALGKSF